MEARSAFAASIVRRFQFIPNVVSEEEQEQYRFGICVTPTKSYFKGLYEGLNGHMKFSPQNRPYTHGDVYKHRVEGVYINADSFSSLEVSDICNGLKEENWDKPDVLQSTFRNDKVAICYGLFAAGLGTPNIYINALCSLIAVHCTFVSIEEREEYPMLALIVLGTIVGPRDHYREIVYRIARVPSCMEVLVGTMQLLKDESPQLYHKFTEFISYGLNFVNLPQTPLLDGVISTVHVITPQGKVEEPYEKKIKIE
jgi:hypothetical protein